MYKVFINRKTIFITNNIKYVIRDNLSVVHKYPKYNNLYTIIETFASDENLLTLFLVSQNPERTFKYLFSIFIPITAAGGIVFDDNNNILFIFRRNKWDLPKGKVEIGESPQIAAIREVFEETGLSDISVINRISSTFHLYVINNNWMIKETIWFAMTHKGSLYPVPQISEDITDIKWFDRKNLNIPLSNTFPLIADLILSLDFSDFI